MNTQNGSLGIQMKKGRTFFLGALVCAALSMAACQPITIEGGVTPSADVTPATEATAEATSEDAAIVALASEALASELQVDVDQVEVVSSEAVEWTDSCLGIVDPDTMCAQVITPGFRIVLSVDGQEYEYHTNEDGSVILLATESADDIGALAAQALADELQIDVATVEVVSIEEVEWSDSCLGVNDPETMCMQVITPGYLIVLSADGEQFEYHSNADGSMLLLAVEPGE